MAVLTSSNALGMQSSQTDLRSAKTPLLMQIMIMAWRSLITAFRTPAAIIPGIIISVFFLFVYTGSLGNASNFLPGLAGKSYLAFILPVSVVSSALSGAGVAGQAIVRDIENGYFDKLLLTPVSRAALLLGPMIAGAVTLALQTIIVVVVGLLLGLESATGIGGLLLVVGMALLLGIGFSGFTVAIALRTGNAAATQGGSFLFFPLTFLTATFVPVALLSGWIKTAAQYNPITYILEAMRSALLDGWQPEILARGLSSALVMGIVLFLFALISLRARTQRR
ncbi:MAG: ABC transporter permease [Anaerolineae bacterium]